MFDYVIAFFLILPYIIGFHAHGEDTWILGVFASAIVAYTIITDFEYGIFKLLPMKLHLALDALVGLLLIVLPFVLTLHNYYFFWPVVIGFAQLLLAVLSNSKPYVVTYCDLDITRHA